MSSSSAPPPPPTTTATAATTTTTTTNPATAATTSATTPNATSTPLDQQQNQPNNILEAIGEFESSIPDAVVNHFLNISGMQTNDQRIIKLIAIAAQKFIFDIVSDSLQHCKMRGQKKTKKYILTIEDLASALDEYGIEIRRQNYFN